MQYHINLLEDRAHAVAVKQGPQQWAPWQWGFVFAVWCMAMGVLASLLR